MSEPKRVTFETISTGSSKNLASGASSKDDKTVRLQLKLFEPNADSFPQFNFKKLCRAEKEKKKIALPNGFVDPLEEIDHDAERLALEFERKYGNAYAGSDARAAKGLVSTADKGAGYDENNGFIDDSEAFDELVPDEMDTDRGGFYINSGHLQFRSKAPKRALSVSSGDESDSLSEMSATNENGNANKKQKLHEKSKIKKDNSKKPDVVKSKEKPVPVISTTIEQTVGVSNNSKEVKTTTVKDMLRAKRDALLKRSKSTSSATSDDSSSSDSSSSDSSSDADQSRHSDEEEFNGVENQSIKTNAVAAGATGSKTINKPTVIQINGVTLTDNIPPDAESKLLDTLSSSTRDAVHRFVEISKNYKENLLDSHQTLDILYEIVKANQSDSTQIYGYLEKVLPYSKQQLEKEVNDIGIRRIQSEVRSLEREMQMEINSVMPNAEANYKLELKRVEEQRAIYKGSDKPEHQFRNPRRKFPWNNKLKSDLPKLLAKWQSLYDQRQIPAQTIEQYTDAYITDKLLPMWPAGWMKIPEIQSHFMPKTKDRDGKKSSSEHKTSKSPHPMATGPSLTAENVKDATMVTAAMAANVVPGMHNAEKRKSHSVKEPTKMPKYNHDKITLSKTDKKHHHSPSDRSILSTSPTIVPPTPPVSATATATSLLTMPLGDSYNSKPTTSGKIDHSPLMGSVGTLNNVKPKSINVNTNSNGSALNYNRLPEPTKVEYISPTKKSSDAFSISQLISYSTPNHSSLSSITHQPQLAYNNSTAAASTAIASSSSSSSSSSSLLLPAPLPHPSALSKNTPSSGNKSKSDSHHRSQSSSNGSNNNNFLHNNNNSKQSTPRLKDTQIIDLSGDTDDGEVAAKKPKHHKHHKHNKKSKESGSSVMNNSMSTSASASAGSSASIANNLSALATPVQSMINQMHHPNTASIGMTPTASDEVDHNKIIHDLKELSASNSSRKSYDSILENQSEFKQHYNHYRVSSPPYDRKQDHFF